MESHLPSNVPVHGASFDVLIPCYNYGRYLRDAAESVLAQDVELRVLIIDDASQDDSALVGQALANEDSRVTFRRHPRNRGHIATYNEGIAWAEADFFALVSADDILLPGALARAAKVFRSDPQISMVHGRAVQFEDGVPIQELLSGTARAQPWMGTSANADRSGSGVPVKLLETQLADKQVTLSTSAFYRANRQGNRVHTSSVVSRTSVQKKAGGYLAELPHAGDYEMWLRLAAYGPVGYVPHFQMAIRRHGNNMSLQYSFEEDILQRALVLLTLDTSVGPILPEGLLMEMRTSAAAEAVRAAGISLAKGDRALRKELEANAIALDPNVVGGLDWKLYGLKQMLGQRIWNQLRNCKLRSEKTFGQVRALLASKRYAA